MFNLNIQELIEGKKDYKPFIYNVLNQNKDKEWVKRILDPNVYPKLDNSDNSYSTHIMSWADTGGIPYKQEDQKYMAYPQIIGTKNGLKKLSEQEAKQHAFKNKTGILFNTPEEAELFTTHYKDIWNK